MAPERERDRSGGADARASQDAGEHAGEPGGHSNRRRRGSTSLWEWSVAALGALIVASTIGFMLYRAASRPTAALPRIAVQVDTIVPNSGGFQVRFTARNEGMATVARLTVEGELRSDTGAVEESETTIDYVPAGSKRRAGLFFTHDPRRFRLVLRPKGYDHP